MNKEDWPKVKDKKKRVCGDCFEALETDKAWFCRLRDMAEIKKDTPICFGYEGVK